MVHTLLSQYLVQDRFKSFDKEFWSTLGDAAFEQQTQRVRLTDNATNELGHLSVQNDITSDIWHTNFSVEIGEGTTTPEGSVAIWFFAEKKFADYKPDNAIGVVLDHENDRIQLLNRTDGGEEVAAQISIVLDNENFTFYSVEVFYNNGKIEVRFNGSSVIDYTFDVNKLDTKNRGMYFSGRTGSSESLEQFIDDVTIIIPSDRIMQNALGAWDNQGISVAPRTNNRKLLRALLGGIEQLSLNTFEVRDSHHIRTATGAELDKIGKLIGKRRKSNETDEKYRIRLILAFRLNSVGGTFDELAQFFSVLLDTDVENINFETKFEALPATITVRTDSQILDANVLSNTEITNFAGEVVQAGHRVTLETTGTFILIGDGDIVNDPETGLTGDSDLTEGGTLTGDI